MPKSELQKQLEKQMKQEKQLADRKRRDDEKREDHQKQSFKNVFQFAHFLSLLFGQLIKFRFGKPPKFLCGKSTHTNGFSLSFGQLPESYANLEERDKRRQWGEFVSPHRQTNVVKRMNY